MAERLGIEGANPARAAQRIERGENAVDAPMASRIMTLTKGAVTPWDIHQTRTRHLDGRSANDPPPTARATA